MGFFQRNNKHEGRSRASTELPTFEEANRRLGEIADALVVNSDKQKLLFTAKMQGKVSDRESNSGMEWLTMQEKALTAERERLLAIIEKLPRGLGRSATNGE